MICDQDGKVAICDECGQVHSPYWSAAKSAHLHRNGMGHRVRVMHASDALRQMGRA